MKLIQVANSCVVDVDDELGYRLVATGEYQPPVVVEVEPVVGKPKAKRRTTTRSRAKKA